MSQRQYHCCSVYICKMLNKGFSDFKGYCTNFNEQKSPIQLMSRNECPNMYGWVDSRITLLQYSYTFCSSFLLLCLGNWQPCFMCMSIQTEILRKNRTLFTMQTNFSPNFTSNFVPCVFHHRRPQSVCMLTIIAEDPGTSEHRIVATGAPCLHNSSWTKIVPIPCQSFLTIVQEWCELTVCSQRPVYW
jgi:hypothetical protein